jgi:hypothetical protein
MRRYQIREEEGADQRVAWTEDKLPQRGAMYPNRMPQPDGMPTRTSDHLSWYFRRNYTWSVVDFSDEASTWWDATGRSFANSKYEKAKYDNPTGYDGILCALNTFGDKYFRVGSNNKYNGYCLRGPRYNSLGWLAIYHAAQCKITFGTTTKRSLDGDNNWEVLGECCSPAPPLAMHFLLLTGSDDFVAQMFSLWMTQMKRRRKS